MGCAEQSVCVHVTKRALSFVCVAVYMMQQVVSE